jgi:hypothetical protein
LYGIVSEPDWDFYSFAFEESGMEVYEGLTLEAARGEMDELGPIDRSKLETREVLAGVQAKYYEIEEKISSWPVLLAATVRKNWQKGLSIALKHVTDRSAEDWANWVEELDNIN